MNKIYTISNLMKTLTIVLLVSLFTGKVYAQNEPMYSQYMFNMMAVNPAYAGSRGAIGFNYFGRAQWSGIAGAPTTNSISLNGSTLDGKLGLGVQLYNDKIGVYSNNVANFMIASRIKVSDDGVLSGGIQLGVRNSRIDLLNVKNVYDPNDVKFQQNVSNWDPIMGAGVLYNTDKYYIGLSVPNILSSANIYSNSPGKTNDYHFFLAGGYVFDLSEDVKLKPSTLLKMSSGAPMEFDLNANVWIKDMIGLGASLRTGDAYVGMAELQLSRQLRVGYAYDITTSALKTIAGSTNEVMFRYEFGGKESKNVKSTRYF
jgi:type IX secretion system PorP/SprF family membrane protein